MLPHRLLCGLYVALKSGRSHTPGLLSVIKCYKSTRGFSLNHVVVLAKTTRFEFESQQHDKFSEDTLRQYLKAKGSDYDGLFKRHQQHLKRLDNLLLELKKRNIKHELVDKAGYTNDVINRADVIISAGGDGTFLLAASKIVENKKPIIGFNTDPLRSEGYLCLPKKYSDNVSTALDFLTSGQFRWLWRQRIRVTMSGKHQEDEGVDLQQLKSRAPEKRFDEHVKENEVYSNVSKLLPSLPDWVLPVRALNEVFIGESLSARVSYYELSVDNFPSLKQKSSGVTVCTGTGSSSWSLHINHLSFNNVKQILDIAQSMCPSNPDCLFPMDDEKPIEEIARTYNSSLWFGPEEPRMAYTIRDPVKNGIFHIDYPRGFAQRLNIRSRMYDAHLVIDGGSAFRFNDGAIANFEILPEDALCCVCMGAHA